MAGELVSFRYIVDGRTCLDRYVLNVGDEQSFFSIAEELCKTSAEEKRPPQFRFAIPRKSGEEEDQAEWSFRCFVGKDRGEATVEVGEKDCCSTAQQFGRFVTLELKTGEHRQRPTAGSAFAVLMSSPARGGFSVGQLPPKKGANTVSFVVTGGCSTRWWMCHGATVHCSPLVSGIRLGSVYSTEYCLQYRV